MRVQGFRLSPEVYKGVGLKVQGGGGAVVVQAFLGT